MISIALFASGTGTNALNLLEKVRSYPNLKISCLIIDTDTSPLPEIVKDRFPQVAVHKILPNPDLNKKDRRNDHEAQIVEVLARHEVKWGMLAGYMRIIGPRLLNYFGMQRLVNIHPSLLPAFPGLHAFERAFEAGVKESGITIHLVDEGMDTGPILLQRSFPRLPSDTLSDFIQRGKDIEWELYPEILKQLNQSALGA
jgi:phosphoribosylglycinamide formyltransferase 1